MSAAERSSWRDRPEAGTAMAMRLIIWIGRAMGRKVLRIILVPVALYFFLVRGTERKASREFLERATGKPPSVWQIYRHFLTFAEVTADRIYLMTDAANKVPVNFNNLTRLRKVRPSSKGGIILAAHLGSFEAARILGTKRSGIEMRIVLDRSINQRFLNSLEALDSDFAEKIIDTGQSAPSLALKVAETLQRGEWVGFLADRFISEDRSTQCEFMGREARFPLGPFLIAAAIKAPIYCIFPLYINGTHEVYFEEITDSLDIPRRGRDEEIKKYVQNYASLLEKYARRAPYSWFNFYDFWAEN
jgi:predicted LPLAT superfamily acyltransferase